MSRVDEKRVKDVIYLTDKGNSDRAIAEILTKKYGYKVSRDQVTYIRRTRKIPPGGTNGPTPKRFKVINSDGVVVKEGSVKEISEFFEVSPDYVYSLINLPRRKDLLRGCKISPIVDEEGNEGK